MGSLFAIIPAAGHSRRMGRPKLLLPWRGSTVIERLLRELLDGGVNRVFVVVRPDDRVLAESVERGGGSVVRPATDPPDMRASVETALHEAFDAKAGELGLKSPDVQGWMLIPADHPLVTARTIRLLLSEYQRTPAQILIPIHAGKRGHPTVLPRLLAPEVFDIPAEHGLNWLVRRHVGLIREIPVDDPGVTADLDTPEDYAYWLSQSDGALDE